VALQLIILVCLYILFLELHIFIKSIIMHWKFTCAFLVLCPENFYIVNSLKLAVSWNETELL